MIFSRISSSMKPHHLVPVLVALTNRKGPGHPYQLCFSSSVTLSTSSLLFGGLSLFTKYETCRKYSVLGGHSLVNLLHEGGKIQSDTERTYQVVVAATRDMGIGKNGKLPWKLPSDLKFFKEITMCTSDLSKKNAVIMGRKTWESIPPQYRPLPGRLNVVLTRSRSFNVATAANVITCGSISSALELLASSPYSLSIDKVFVIGGGQILRGALNGPGCEAIHMTEIDTNIDCDTFIPPVDMSVFWPWYSSLPVTENDIRYCFVSYVRVRKSSSTEPVLSCEGLKCNSNSDSNKLKVDNFAFLPKMIFDKHEEFIYLKLVRDIILSGNLKDDKAGTGALSKFGCQMRFNLRKSFPLFTTKKVFWRGVVEEFLWFISGSTNTKVPQKEIHTWDGNASRDYLYSIGAKEREEADLGPIHGFQMGHFGDRYTNMHADYTGHGYDQLLNVIDKCKSRPGDRRIVLSAWNLSDLKTMTRPPCHMFTQFYVANGELSCQMYQCSADMGHGVPFDIASYALLTCMIAHLSGLLPGDFIYVIGDARVYTTHIGSLQKQLEKLPKPFPFLKINPQKKDIKSFVAADFELTGYDP